MRNNVKKTLTLLSLQKEIIKFTLRMQSAGVAWFWRLNIIICLFTVK
jgi:hypothetical protein